MKIPKLALGLLPLALLTGCSHFGSDKLVESRFNYTAAIGDSWKSQMLLNIVKLRYGDVPIFLTVQSVIDTNSVRTLMNANGSWTDAASPLAWATIFGGEVEYVTAPTVTYAPMGGAQFGKQIMTPIPTPSIIGLLQAGYSADMVLRLTVHAINGRQNHFGLDNETPVDASFYRTLDLISALQASNSISLRVNSVEGKDTVILSIQEPKDADSRANIDELRSLLNLDANTLDFNIVYGATPSSNKEIAILTRSVVDVLADLSGTIEVPAQHIAETRAAPAKVAKQAGGRAIRPLLVIHAGSSKPDDAAVAVPYHKNWYWISDRDISSKNTFSFLLFIMNMSNQGEEDESPSIVLPTGH
jgi:hypothetical protein